MHAPRRVQQFAQHARHAVVADKFIPMHEILEHPAYRRMERDPVPGRRRSPTGQAGIDGRGWVGEADSAAYQKPLARSQETGAGRAEQILMRLGQNGRAKLATPAREVDRVANQSGHETRRLEHGYHDSRCPSSRTARTASTLASRSPDASTPRNRAESARS